MKIRIIGSSIVVTSTITAEQIRKLKQAAPELLEVRNENGTPTFRIAEAEGSYGTINRYGAELVPGVTDNLVCTILLPEDVTAEEAKRIAYETLATAKENIEKIEAEVAAKYNSIIRAEHDFIENIEVVG